MQMLGPVRQTVPQLQATEASPASRRPFLPARRSALSPLPPAGRHARLHLGDARSFLPTAVEAVLEAASVAEGVDAARSRRRQADVEERTKQARVARRAEPPARLPQPSVGGIGTAPRV